MAEGGIRDLLVKLGLDISDFTSKNKLLKGELNSLKTEFKAVESDETIANRSDQLKQNLESQIRAVKDQIANYKTEIDGLYAAMQGAAGDGKKESYLVQQMNLAQTALNNSQTALNDLEKKLKNFDAKNFTEMVQEWSMFFTSLDQSYNQLIGDWAGATSDSAYEIAASREAARKAMYKIAGEDAGEEWLQETEQQVRAAIREIPVTYEHFMNVMADAMQAGGLAYTDALRFAEMFTKLESAAPTLAGSEGVASFSRYLTLMDVAASEYENIASVVVELGNNFAVTEEQLVNTANRAASGLRAAGIDAVDGLAVVAAALAGGMNEAAAASSLEKLTGGMAKAADSAAGSYAELLTQIQALNPAFESIHDFMVDMGVNGTGNFSALVAATDLPARELNMMLTYAQTAEKYAAVMGQTVQEFGAWYTSDPAMAMIEFFGTLGGMSEDGGESLLAMLDSMSITEIRTARLAKNLALSNEMAEEAIATARDAAREGTALDEEFGQMADAEVSNQVKRQNAMENALQDMGEVVTQMRKPWQDFFAEIQDGFSNMPGWVQTGVAGTIEVLGQIGNVITSVGDVASGIYYSGEVAKQIKGINWSSVGAGAMKFAKGVGKVALPVAVIAGFISLADTINQLSTDTEAISKNLAEVKINIDEESQRRALEMLDEVKQASQALSTPELDEKYAGISRNVKQGFGTVGMFAQALAYEQAKAKNEAEEIYGAFGQILNELDQKSLAAATEGEKQLVQQQIKETEAQMRVTVAEAEAAYAKSMNELVNGALRQQEGAAEKLAGIGAKYNYLDLFMAGASASAGGGPQAAKDFVNANREMLMAISQETGVSFLNDLTGQVDFAGAVKEMYGQLAQEVAAFAQENEDLTTIFSTLLSSGVMGEIDLTALEGQFLSALQAMDILSIAQQGAKDWRDIGTYSMAGLGDGVAAGQAGVEAAVSAVGQGMIDSIRGVLQVHSPSQVMMEIGGYAVEGLARGVESSQSMAVSAIRQVGAAMQAEAAAQAARVAAILSMAGYGPVAVAGAAAGATAATAAARSTSTIHNVFNIQSGSMAEQQNVARLAQKLEALGRKTNAGVGVAR